MSLGTIVLVMSYDIFIWISINLTSQWKDNDVYEQLLHRCLRNTEISKWKKNQYFTVRRHSTNIVKIKNFTERLTMRNILLAQ
jgi:hypothetical protein